MDFQMEEKWRRRKNSMRSKKSVKWLQLLSNFKPIKRRILAMNGNRLLMKTPQQISGCSNHGASAEKSNESIWKLFSVDIWQKQLKLVILSSILRSACSPNSQNPFWLHPLRMGFYSMHTFLCCVFDFQVYLNSSSSLLRCFCFVACLGCLTPISTRPQQAAAADRNKSKNEMMHKCTRTDEMWKEKPPKWNWNLMFLRSFISFFFREIWAVLSSYFRIWAAFHPLLFVLSWFKPINQFPPRFLRKTNMNDSISPNGHTQQTLFLYVCVNVIHLKINFTCLRYALKMEI